MPKPPSPVRTSAAVIGAAPYSLWDRPEVLRRGNNAEELDESSYVLCTRLCSCQRASRYRGGCVHPTVLMESVPWTFVPENVFPRSEADWSPHTMPVS